MEILAAYDLTRSYRDAAKICGVSKPPEPMSMAEFAISGMVGALLLLAESQQLRRSQGEAGGHAFHVERFGLCCDFLEPGIQMQFLSRDPPALRCTSDRVCVSSHGLEGEFLVCDGGNDDVRQYCRCVRVLG